jgi:hypothetical protein
MIDPILRAEQPHPIRRAAANLTCVHRYVCEFDDNSPEALTLSGLLVALDRSVRAIENAGGALDVESECRWLAKHADTVDRMREQIGNTPRRAAQLSMREAHDALIEATKLLARAPKGAARSIFPD